ncbi:MAG: tetraacyldisaccharide 4'-kinase [Flavobacteriales bacterium]
MSLKKSRIILLPISIPYGIITYIRNKLYDQGILKSTSFNLPIICIGNLSIGGTGKTPHTEYIIHLLKNNYKTAVLSRGYGRKSKGYILADDHATSEVLGDEPLQFYSKFKNEITVAVDENRVEGIQNLIQTIAPEVILLDDAFQHRAIQAGFNIILTPFDDLFTEDHVLPAGNLREYPSGINRADVVIVTKCPVELNEYDKNHIISKIQAISALKIYFSYIEYDTKIYGQKTLDIKKIFNEKIILLTGIANPKPMMEYLKTKVEIVEHLSFPDHHNFTKKDISLIKEKTKNHIILTTEKDYMRLKFVELSENPLFYLPIRIKLDKPDEFDQMIKQYVRA